MNINYEKKYLKYKLKYLTQKGGSNITSNIKEEQICLSIFVLVKIFDKFTINLL